VSGGFAAKFLVLAFWAMIAWTLFLFVIPAQAGIQ